MKFNVIKLLIILSPPFLSVLVWFLNRIVNEQVFFSAATLTYLMQILGVITVSLFTLNFFLTVKHRKLEVIMNGLDNQFAVHKIAGRVIYSLLLLHIFIGIYRSNFQNFSEFLIYSNSPINNLGILSFWTLTILITLTVAIRLPYQVWKYTHKFMIVPFLLASVHGILNSINQPLIPLTSIYIIIMMVIGVSSYLYTEIYLINFGPISRYKLKGLNHNKNIIELFVEPIKEKVEYYAGQYFFISFPNNSRIRSETHPFAISTAPSESSRITIKIAGDYTESLLKAEAGDEIKLIGPFGEFHNNNFREYNSSIWVAGGIGITPFLAMLRERVLNNDQRKVYLVYGVNNESEAHYFEEIRNLIEGKDNFKFYEHFSDKEGFIDGQYLKSKTGQDFFSSNIMICGPSKMMTSIQKSCLKLGKEKKDIFFENFSFK